MHSYQKLTCSACGAALDPKPGLRKVVCSYCGTPYILSEPSAAPGRVRETGKYDNPIDIIITPIPQEPIELEMPFGGRFVKDVETQKETMTPDHDIAFLSPQIWFFSALAMGLENSYRLTLEFNYASNGFAKMDLVKGKSLLTRITNASYHRDLARMAEGYMKAIIETLNFEATVTKEEHGVCDRTCTLDLNPVTAKKHVSPEFLAFFLRLRQHPVVLEIAEELGRNLRDYSVSDQLLKAELDISVEKRGCAFKCYIAGERYSRTMEPRFQTYGMQDLEEQWQQVAFAGALLTAVFERYGEEIKYRPSRWFNEREGYQGYQKVLLTRTETVKKVYQAW